MKTFKEKIEKLKSKLIRILIIKDGNKELAECISEIRQAFDILIKESYKEFLSEILPEEKEEDLIKDPGYKVFMIDNIGWNKCREETKSRASEIINKL